MSYLGYVQNITPKPVFAFQRIVVPGQKIELLDLYKGQNSRNLDEFLVYIRNICAPSEWRVYIPDTVDEVLNKQDSGKVTVDASITIGAILPDTEDILKIDENTEEVFVPTKIKVTAKPSKKEVKKTFKKKDIEDYRLDDILALDIKGMTDIVPKIKNAKLLREVISVTSERSALKDLRLIVEAQMKALGY